MNANNLRDAIKVTLHEYKASHEHDVLIEFFQSVIARADRYAEADKREEQMQYTDLHWAIRAAVDQ